MTCTVDRVYIKRLCCLEHLQTRLFYVTLSIPYISEISKLDLLSIPLHFIYLTYMSALAARRAAQIAQGVQSSPIQTPGTSSRASPRTRAPSVSSGSTESVSSDEEVVAGPSKRVRLSASALKPRYYAAPIEDEEEELGRAGPSRPIKRKRAYSPGAPAESDEDSSVAGEDGPGGGIGVGLLDGGFGEDGVAGPSRTRSSGLDSVQPATTNFSSRRGVNVELLSIAVLQKAGLEFISGPGLIISLSSSEVSRIEW
jgi:hypothetical protein